MSKSRFGICIGALTMLLVATSSYGSVIFYLSPVTVLDGTSAPGNPVINVNKGESFSLGVWVSSPSGAGGVKINGIALDIIETASLLSADSFVILESGQPELAGHRWESASDGNYNDSNTVLFSGSNAVGPENLGLTGTSVFRGLDGNYDASADGGNGAFLYAILHMTAGAVDGSTDLFMRVGVKKIGYSPDTDPTVSFGTGDAPISREIENNMSSLADATIIVPEPTVMGLLAIGGLAVIARRKRR